MADTPIPMPLRSHAVLLAASIVALTVLSFHGFLDRLAYYQVTDTTAESIRLYALSRAINAGISVLQTAGISVGFNVEIGQFLDPVNDAIERLSTVLVWAIGSLFLQRVLLEVTASIAFQWAFLASAAIAALSFLPFGFERTALLYSRITGVPEEAIRRWQYFFIRIFIMSVLVRFIAPTFIGGSFLVSQLFLQPHLDRHKAQLQELKDEVSIGAEFDFQSAEQLLQERKKTEADIAFMRDDRSSLQARHYATVQKIADLEEKAGFGRFVPEMFGGQPPGEELKALRSKRDDLASRMDVADDRIEAKEAELACIDQQVGGESCASWLEQVVGVGKAGLERVSAAVEATSEMFVVVATVLMAIFAKNILFPLLFLAIVFKSGQAIGRRALRLDARLKRDAGKPEAEAGRIGPANDRA